MKTFKDLIVWQRAVDLAPLTYNLIKRFPKEEMYALSAQARRAVVSVASNIAEGQARAHRKEFIQHLNYAKGSLAELHTQMIIAMRLGYLNEEDIRHFEQMKDSVAAPLHALINKMEATAD
jgi:four helix bundle protein